jgi:hypothetical protein
MGSGIRCEQCSQRDSECGNVAMIPNFQPLKEDLYRLTHEADMIYQQVVLPEWGGPNHGMPSTLYGYIMSAFAHIDLVSVHWHGSKELQSQRMTTFMTSYMHPEHNINSLAVQMWRHNLMHTGAPRQLVDSKSGRTFRWLLHWGDEHLPRDQHFKLQTAEPIFNMSLFGLLDDIEHANDKYHAELSNDQKLQKNFLAAQTANLTYNYREIPTL